MTALTPSSTVSSGGWVSSLGGALHLAVQDYPFSDSAHIGWNSAGLSTCILGLASGTDPGTDAGFKLQVRARRSGSATLELVLTCDGDPVATLTPSLTTDWATYEHDLTTEEAELITDFTALGMTLTGGGAFVQVDVSGLALLVPEGGSAGGWTVLSAVY